MVVWMPSHWWHDLALTPDFHLPQLLLPCQEGTSISSLAFIGLMGLRLLPVHIRLPLTTHKPEDRLSQRAGPQEGCISVCTSTHIPITKLVSKNFLSQSISWPSNYRLHPHFCKPQSATIATDHPGNPKETLYDSKIPH
jgi:hypothetical protein